MKTRRQKQFDEIDIQLAQDCLAKLDQINPSNYPELSHIPSSLVWKFIPVPIDAKQPEYVHVPLGDVKKYYNNKQTRILVVMQQWNSLWEAGHLRYDFFKDELPAELKFLEFYKDSNLYLLPDSRTNKFDAYSPLFFLLPQKILHKFSLPILKKGIWPFWTANHLLGPFITNDFEQKLSNAFAYYIWPFLNPRSKLKAFSNRDPLVILSHNLNFWLPYTIRVIEDRIRSFGRVPCEDNQQMKKLKMLRKRVPAYFNAERPSFGGPIWLGEEESKEATEEIVNIADKEGKLRTIIDAVLSSRVEDDFSSVWSYEKEDFERKLYKKRSKIRVSFVELDDTVPVHGPSSEIHEDLLWEDFFSVLDYKEQKITICLRNGFTKVGDIAKRLGYANHSPISKVLKRVRNKAIKYFDLN